MKVLITRADGRDLGLVFEQRRVVEVFPMETDILPFHPGDIILGQVQDVAKSLKAAFIRLLPSGKEQTECGGPAYLALQDVLHPETRLVQGNLLPVQIIAERWDTRFMVFRLPANFPGNRLTASGSSSWIQGLSVMWINAGS